LRRLKTTTPRRVRGPGAASAAVSARSAGPALRNLGHEAGCLQGDQLLTPLQCALRAPGGLADQRVQPGQDPAVLARRARRQLRDRLVGGDRERLDLDQVLVELRDQEVGVGVVRGGRFDTLARGLRCLVIVTLWPVGG
jgi:hypothetical protein